MKAHHSALPIVFAASDPAIASQPEAEKTTMNARNLVLLVMLAASAAMLSQKAIAGSGGKISAPTGQFALTSQGTLVICYNSQTEVQESCSTQGAFPYALTKMAVGVETRDAMGASCRTDTAVYSVLPPGVTPPDIASATHTVYKATDYDPATGTGDTSFVEYNGGKCVGASFDNSGATVISTGTPHLAVSENGHRIDIVTTGLTNSVGSYGSFTLSSTLLRQ